MPLLLTTNKDRQGGGVTSVRWVKREICLISTADEAAQLLEKDNAQRLAVGLEALEQLDKSQYTSCIIEAASGDADAVTVNRMVAKRPHRSPGARAILRPS